MPDYNRRQRSAPCGTCGGELRFYPKPLESEEAMVAEEVTEGEWAHLNASDWIRNPHPPAPVEGQAASA